MSDIDSQFDSKGAAVLTEEDIQRCFDNLFKKYQASIIDKIMSELAKKAVGIFITIIFACFATFGALTYFISVTKENLELKAQIEKKDMQIYQLEHSNQKVK